MHNTGLTFLIIVESAKLDTRDAVPTGVSIVSRDPFSHFHVFSITLYLCKSNMQYDNKISNRDINKLFVLRSS